MSRWLAQRGIPGRRWELKDGACGDITSPAALGQLLADIRAGRCVGVMLAPPCRSFSRARDRTRVIRSREFPCGVPGLEEADLRRLAEGNACLRAASRIFRACVLAGVPAILENPWSSKMWFHPDLAGFVARPSCHLLRGDFCQYGTRWKKPTGFLVAHLAVEDCLRFSKCCTGPRGLCCRSGNPHLQLTGSGPGGKPWTQVAEPYPKKLCAALAGTFLQHLYARQFNYMYSAVV